MWTAQRSAGEKTRYQPWVDQGEVTLSEEVTGVYLDGERRQLTVSSPGGYHWKPGVGEQVLVVNSNQGDKMVHIIASEREEEPDRLEPLPVLDPGDVCVTSDGLGRIHLTNNQVRIQGNIYINELHIYEFVTEIIKDYLESGSQE